MKSASRLELSPDGLQRMPAPERRKALQAWFDDCYFLLSELESARGPLVLPIERDVYLVRHADRLLEGDDALLAIAWEALGRRHPKSRRHSRPATPFEVVLLLILKHLTTGTRRTRTRGARQGPQAMPLHQRRLERRQLLTPHPP